MLAFDCTNLINVRMPVFIMDGLCGRIVNTRYECWMCEINSINIDGELVGDGFCDFPSYNLSMQAKEMKVSIGKVLTTTRSGRAKNSLAHLICCQCFFSQEALGFGQSIDIDEISALGQCTRVQVQY